MNNKQVIALGQNLSSFNTYSLTAPPIRNKTSTSPREEIIDPIPSDFGLPNYVFSTLECPQGGNCNRVGPSGCPLRLRANGSSVSRSMVDDEGDVDCPTKDTLQSLVQSSIRGSNHRGIEGVDEAIVASPCQGAQGDEYCLPSLLLEKSTTAVKPPSWRHSIICFGNKNTQLVEQPQAISYGKIVSEKQFNAKKARIRWTKELHKQFIECVNRLGGAKKATPKGILKLMNCDGLTIFHVKSHLQKYRVARYMPEVTEEGNDEKSTCLDSSTTQLDAKTGMQIVEALRLQVDVQRRLYEQLETQRNLQLRIEEQAKQLKEMFDSQVKTRCTPSDS